MWIEGDEDDLAREVELWEQAQLSRRSSLATVREAAEGGGEGEGGFASPRAVPSTALVLLPSLVSDRPTPSSPPPPPPPRSPPRSPNPFRLRLRRLRSTTSWEEGDIDREGDVGAEQRGEGEGGGGEGSARAHSTPTLRSRFRHALASSRSSSTHRSLGHEGLAPLDAPRVDDNDCGICLDACALPFALRACRHNFCRECLRQYTAFVRANRATRAAFCCPLCKQEVVDDDLEDLMGREFVAALAALGEQEDDANLDPEVAVLAQRDFLRAARVHHFRYCPACNSPIQKHGGCDNMQCHCGHQFSWSRAIPVVPCNRLHWDIRHTGWRRYAATTCPGCSRVAKAKLVAWRVSAGVLAVPCVAAFVVASGVATGLQSAAQLSYDVCRDTARSAARRGHEWRVSQERRNWLRTYQSEIRQSALESPFTPSQETARHDRRLARELARASRFRWTLLVTGPSGCGKSSVIQCMSMMGQQSPHSPRAVLAAGYLRFMHEVITTVTTARGLEGLECHAQDIDTVLTHTPDHAHWAAAASRLLHTGSAFHTALLSIPPLHLPPTHHFFTHPAFHTRFATPAMQRPTPVDLLYVHRRHLSTVSETVVEAEGVVYTLLETPFEMLNHKVVVPRFDSVNAVIFVAALGDCFRPHPSDPDNCKLVDVVERFRALCTSRPLAQKPVILFLNQRDLFAQQLQHSPQSLQEAFPEYAGGDDNAAFDFVLQQFLAAKSPPDRELYAHSVCALDPDHVRFVVGSIRDILLSHNIAHAGFI